MEAPSSLPRQIPLNVTTAPISPRPFVSAEISRAMSKSSCWMRIVTRLERGALMRASRMPWILAAGHRREKGDFAGPFDRRPRLDMGVVDRRANHPWRLEGVGIGLAAFGEPCDQFFDGLDAPRRLDHFLGFADPFPYPGEIFQLHPSSSLMRW